MHTLMAARYWVGLLYLVLIGAGFVMAHYLPAWTGLDMRPSNEAAIHRFLMGLLALYMVLAAIPFVPGAEIGFGMLAVFGGQAAFLVYAGMTGALTLAFFAGRCLPRHWVTGFFGVLGMTRARDLVEECHTLDLEKRAAFLAAHVPTRFLPFLLHHRYLSLAVLFNVPGNTLLGGGGGIAFAAGASRIFSVPGYLLTVAFAVLPIPLAFYLFW
jgi:hypothetical protein